MWNVAEIDKCQANYYEFVSHIPESRSNKNQQQQQHDRKKKWSSFLCSMDRFDWCVCCACPVLLNIGTLSMAVFHCQHMNRDKSVFCAFQNMCVNVCSRGQLFSTISTSRYDGVHGWVDWYDSVNNVLSVKWTAITFSHRRHTIWILCSSTHRQ